MKLLPIAFLLIACHNQASSKSEYDSLTLIHEHNRIEIESDSIALESAQRTGNIKVITEYTYRIDSLKKDNERLRRRQADLIKNE